MSEEQTNKGIFKICKIPEWGILLTPKGWIFPQSDEFNKIYFKKLAPKWYNYSPVLSKEEVNCTCDILSPLISSKDARAYNTTDWKSLHKCFSGNKETYPKKIKYITSAVGSMIYLP